MQSTTNANSAGLARFDIYAFIHKGLRAFMSDTLARVSRLDCDDPRETAAVLQQVRELADFCEGHVEHENDFVHTAMEKRRPGSAAGTAGDHVHHKHAFGELRRFADSVAVAAPGARTQAATGLRRYLSAFIADNLLHMNIEETENNAVLWAEYDDAELLAIEHAIVASLSPEEAGLAMRWIVPSISPAERAMLLGGMRAGAPAPVFEGVLAIAKEQLSMPDWEKLVSALGIRAEPEQRLAA